MRLVLAEHNAVSFEANVTQLQSLKLDTLVAAVLDDLQIQFLLGHWK